MTLTVSLRRPAWRALLPMLAVCLALASCGGGDSTGTRPSGAPDPSAIRASSEIYGVATLDGPVANGAVQVFGLDGVLIAETRTASNGHFTVDVARPPADYRVVVTGGSYQGKPIAGSLSSDVRGRPHYGRYTPVNPVTTLASLRIKAHPAIAYDQAVADTKRFFGIPAPLDMGFNLGPAQFSGRSFAAAADNQGGLTPMMAVLLQELEAGKTHFFHQQVLRGTEADVALFVAKGVLNGVLGKAGGEAFSSVMGALGLGGGDDGQAAARAAAQAQMAKLNEISDAINALSAKVDNLQHVLLAKIDQQAYVTALGQSVRGLIIANQHVDTELQALLLAPPGSSRVQQLDSYIFVMLVQGGMESWDSVLSGQLTPQSSLMVMWSKVVQQLRLTLYDELESNTVQAQWDHLDGEQARSLAYVVDYMRSHLPGSPLTQSDPTAAIYTVEGDILPLIARWRASRQNQIGLLRGNARMVDTFAYPSGDAVLTEVTPYPMPLAAGLVIDRTSGQIWARNAVFSTTLPSDQASIDRYVSDAIRPLQQSTGLSGWRLPTFQELNPVGNAWLGGLARVGVATSTAHVVTTNRIQNSDLMAFDALVVPFFELVHGGRCLVYAHKGGSVAEWSPLIVDASHFAFYRFNSLPTKDVVGNTCPAFLNDALQTATYQPDQQPAIDLFVFTPLTDDFWYR